MGRKSRKQRLDNEWLGNYAKEATKIIIDLSALVKDMPEEMTRRINRLKGATLVYDAIKKNQERFVP